ncbi:hypothetical protein HY969_01220 [Candidatus Kaiserbacteria bacterium]|nr:hypothetical protein [Candidatus Kaiserbacteria bacterium]
MYRAFFVSVLLLTPFAVGAQNETIRCSIKAEPGTVVSGESVRLTWSSFGASSASLDLLGAVPTSGSRTLPVNESRTFRLTVKGQTGQSTCDVAVHVTEGRPSCFITAWPQTITQGQNATVSWGSSYATSLFISGLGQVAPSGTRTVQPSMTTTYSLSASGPGGNCTGSAHVTVQQKQSPYGYFPQVAQSLFAPFVPSGNKQTGNNTSSNQKDEWYFEDEYYYDGFDSDKYTTYWDDEYDVIIDDEYYDTYGESFYDGYADEYYEEELYGGYGESLYDAYDERRGYYQVTGDAREDCWWDWWCGRGSQADETYDEWDTYGGYAESNYGYNESYYDYAENYYFNDTVYYNNGTVETYEYWE